MGVGLLAADAEVANPARSSTAADAMENPLIVRMKSLSGGWKLVGASREKVEGFPERTLKDTCEQLSRVKRARTPEQDGRDPF